jgi:integrase
MGECEMTKAKRPLTQKRIEHLKAPGRYLDEHGLYLQITKAGVKSWVLRYERKGKEKMLGLGPLHTVSLKQARERAREARYQLLNGNDPLDERKKQKAAEALTAAKAITFKEAAEQYLKAMRPKWKSRKTPHQFVNSLATYAHQKIGRLHVAEIDVGLVMNCIKSDWNEKTVTMNRVRSRIKDVLDWCIACKYREGPNPARWEGNIEYLLPSHAELQKTQLPKHHAALPWAELPVLMVDLAERKGVPARALEFLILTAARTGEVVGATWDEIDFAARVWTVPAERIKGGIEHQVPLSPRAMEILQALPREEGNPYLFVGQREGKPISHLAMLELIGRLRPGITVHGFRSTFRDWCGERTNCPRDVIEFALAHKLPDRVEAAYRRETAVEKRRKLMDAWARYCLTPVAIEGKVTPIRRGA